MSESLYQAEARNSPHYEPMYGSHTHTTSPILTGKKDAEEQRSQPGLSKEGTNTSKPFTVAERTQHDHREKRMLNPTTTTMHAMRAPKLHQHTSRFTPSLE